MYSFNSVSTHTVQVLIYAPHTRSRRITTSWPCLPTSAWRRLWRAHARPIGSQFATRRARAASCRAPTWTRSPPLPPTSPRAPARARPPAAAGSRQLQRPTRTPLRGTTSRRPSPRPPRAHSSNRRSARRSVRSRAPRPLPLQPHPNGSPLRQRPRRQQAMTCTPTLTMRPEAPSL